MPERPHKVPKFASILRSSHGRKQIGVAARELVEGLLLQAGRGRDLKDQIIKVDRELPLWVGIDVSRSTIRRAASAASHPLFP